MAFQRDGVSGEPQRNAWDEMNENHQHGTNAKECGSPAVADAKGYPTRHRTRITASLF